MSCTSCVAPLVGILGGFVIQRGVMMIVGVLAASGMIFGPLGLGVLRDEPFLFIFYNLNLLNLNPS